MLDSFSIGSIIRDMLDMLTVSPMLCKPSSNLQVNKVLNQKDSSVTVTTGDSAENKLEERKEPFKTKKFLDDT